MIDTNKEYIACAAIHYDNHIHYEFMDCYGVKSGFVLCGFRHPFIISVLPTNTFYKKVEERSKWLNIDWEKGVYDENGMPIQTCDFTEGFMTSLGRFVDREEAAQIAITCGQIKELKYNRGRLFSEDIFPLQAINGYL